MDDLMFKVPNGQNPYSTIGRYIRDNTTAIEDMIAVIEIDGVTINELLLVDMHEDGYFVWKSDWWEGEKDISLIDFFPVSDAQKPSAQPEPKRGKWIPVDSFTAFGGDEATWMTHGNPTAFHYCSVCKGQAYAGEDGESLLTDFCPNCGADMRGD